RSQLAVLLPSTRRETKTSVASLPERRRPTRRRQERLVQQTGPQWNVSFTAGRGISRRPRSRGFVETCIFELAFMTLSPFQKVAIDRYRGETRAAAACRSSTSRDFDTFFQGDFLKTRDP